MWRPPLTSQLRRRPRLLSPLVRRSFKPYNRVVVANSPSSFSTRSTQSSSYGSNGKGQGGDSVGSTKKSTPTTKTAIVATLAQEMQKVLRFADSITTPLPLMPADPITTIVVDQQREQVYLQTAALWESLLQNVRDQSLQPQGKHRREISIFCESILRLYAQSDTSNREEIWDSCQTILKFMQLHKITIQEEHCQAAMKVALRQGHFRTAAQLFQQQIDPAESGYRPYRSMTIAEPIGLLALAKDAQQRGAAVVENVMLAVHQMILVSPSDQENYVLAAGTALGHVGQGMGLLAYLNSSLEAPRLGPALVAATMQACLLSGEAETAWNLWQDRATKAAAETEWQWSGGETALSPLCTDLALRAAPAVAHSLAPDQVLSMFQSLIHNGRTVSIEALVGVVRVLEEHGAWQDAVQVWLQALIRSSGRKPFLVFGEEMVCPNVEEAAPVSTELRRELSHVVVPVLRACNGAQEFALGWICLALWQGSLSGEDATLWLDAPSHVAWLTKLQDALKQSSNADEMLTAIMTSLAGLDLPEAACDLYDNFAKVTDNLSQAQNLRDFMAGRRSFLSRLQRDRMLATLGDEVQRFTLVQSSPERLSPEDGELVASALASTIQAMTAWRHPRAGLYLFRWLMADFDNTPVTALADVLTVVQSRIKTTSPQGIPLNDALVSSLVDTHFALDDSRLAIDIFETVTEVRFANDYPLAVMSAIQVLFANDATDDAMYLFQQSAGTNRNPELYVVTAAGLTRQQNWKEVSDVYRLALTSHTISEELSLLAIQAIQRLTSQDKVRLMRSIANEAATLSGMAPLAWAERHYHRLKRMVAFKSLCRLLWWDDAETAYLDELELAIGKWQSEKAAAQIVEAGSISAVSLPNVRIILQGAKRTNITSIPSDKTGIPNVPKNTSDWKRMVDEIVQDLDWTTWQHHGIAASLANDVIYAYRNLGSDDDCIAFTFFCLENDVSVNTTSLEEALKAAVAMNDEVSAQTLQSMVNESSVE